jgi:hypothetical protein
MTEAKWLACDEPRQMLEFLRGKVSDRKVLLFACSCWRRTWRLLAVDGSRDAVGFLEAAADRVPAEGEEFRITCGGRWAGSMTFSREDAEDAFSVAFNSLNVVVEAEAAEAGQVDHEDQLPAYCPFVHDIFGNPFRPVTFDPAWRTSDVLLLARGIYEDRARLRSDADPRRRAARRWLHE